MPQSDEHEAEKRAERLEREAHDAVEFRTEDAIRLLLEALAIRDPRAHVPALKLGQRLP